MKNEINNIEEKDIYAKKFYNYYEDNDYELYDIQEFYYPYYKITCNCIFKEKNKLVIYEEIFLKAIKSGLNDYELLEKFLALDKEIFEEIAAKLHIDKLFIENPHLLLTELGETILNDGATLNSTENEEYIVMDGVTGHISNVSIHDERKNDKSKNKNHIKMQIPYPRNENLDKAINNKAFQTILFEAIKRKDTDEQKLYEIKEILDKPYKFHKKYFALFYKNKDNPKKILILKDGNPDDNITNIIDKIMQEGKDILDFSKESQKEHEKLFDKPSIEEYLQIDDMENGKQLSTYEHPKFFDYLFKYSEKEAIIISPWIKWEVIEGKKNDIEDALKRGVRIYFSYGMKSRNKDDIDESSKAFFENLRRQYPKQFAFKKSDTADHSKIIICDRKWMITTSFNWTSFKGDRHRQERGEAGSFINNTKEIKKIVDKYL